MTRPRHEPAPALSALLLDQMHSYREWDLDPALYIVYTDRLGEVPIPPIARGKHPRVMLQHMAIAVEQKQAQGTAPLQPADMVGVAMMLEFWGFATDDPADRDVWRNKDFSTHPRAYETRMLIAEQRGHPPVVAVHNRDSKNTGQHLPYPQPAICAESLIPGQTMPPLLNNLHRLAMAMCAPPATFRAR